MPTTKATCHPHRELAHRNGYGVDVMLSWHQGTDELTVTVSDELTGAHFELAAEPYQPLEVFNDPFAHAAFRSLTYEEASRLSSAQAIATERPS